MLCTYTLMAYRALARSEQAGDKWHRAAKLLRRAESLTRPSREMSPDDWQRIIQLKALLMGPWEIMKAEPWPVEMEIETRRYA